MSAKGTDLRPPFIQVDQRVMKLNLDPYTGWLYIVVVSLINGKTGTAFPGLNKLSELAHMSKPKVVSCIRELERRRLIRVDRQSSKQGDADVNHYYILPLGVVNDVDNGSKRGKLPVVNDVDSNYIDSNKNELTTVPDGTNGNAVVKNSPVRPRNAWYDAVLEVFDVEAALNGLYVKLLQGKATAKGWRDYNLDRPLSTPEELLAWRDDWRHEHPDLSIVKEPVKVQSAITAWQNKPQRVPRRPMLDTELE